LPQAAWCRSEHRRILLLGAARHSLEYRSNCAPRFGPLSVAKQYIQATTPSGAPPKNLRFLMPANSSRSRRTRCRWGVGFFFVDSVTVRWHHGCYLVVRLPPAVKVPLSPGSGILS
jgi:hypothetical protein